MNEGQRAPRLSRDRDRRRELAECRAKAPGRIDDGNPRPGLYPQLFYQ